MTNEALDRVWRVTVGDVNGKTALQTTELDVAFSVKRNLKAEPNKAQVRISGLGESSRKALEMPKALYLVLEVGYQGELFVIFKGDMRSATSAKQGDASWTTTIASKDSAESFGPARVKRTVAAKTPGDAVLGDLQKDLKAAPGNLKDQIRQGKSPFAAVATVITGAATRAMDNLTRGLGAEWSIQGGALQVLDRGATLAGKAVKLASGGTLIGSPTVDGKGVMTCRSLIVPGLDPGRSIVLDSASLSGAYRIEEVEYAGDTAGNDWYATIHARAFDAAT